MTLMKLNPVTPTTRVPSDVADRIAVMRKQEKTTYRCRDYLGCGGGHDQAVEPARPDASSGPQQSLSAPPKAKPTNAACRTKMVEWCEHVVDFCNFSRETVGVAMGHLDRYLSTHGASARRALADRREYQLAAMTSLYLAIKLNEPMVMDTDLVSQLSRGCYSADDVALMERELLQVLGWRISGPTKMAFVSALLELLPAEQKDGLVGETLLDICRFQTEHATREYCFVTTNPSTIAVAAILNALDAIDLDTFGCTERMAFVEAICDVSGLGLYSAELRGCQSRLRECFVENSGCDLSQILKRFSLEGKTAKARNAEESPVSVIKTSV